MCTQRSPGVDALSSQLERVRRFVAITALAGVLLWIIAALVLLIARDELFACIGWADGVVASGGVTSALHSGATIGGGIGLWVSAVIGFRLSLRWQFALLFLLPYCAWFVALYFLAEPIWGPVRCLPAT